MSENVNGKHRYNVVFDYTKPDRAVVLFCTGKSGIKTPIIPEIFSKLID
jgi:hypothetical protein